MVVQGGSTNYLSLKLDARGMLDVLDNNTFSMEELYDQLAPNASCFVLYSFAPISSSSAHLGK